MIASSADIAADTLSTYVCVIGSGPAGTIVATDLVEAGHAVLVLEAGPAEAGQSAAKSIGSLDTSDTADLPFGGVRQLGGSTNLWAGRMAPLEPIDFAKKSWVPGSGWPISQDELAAHYEQAFSLLGVTGERPAIEAPEHPAGVGAALADGQLDTKSFFWAPNPFKASEHLHGAVTRSRKLRIVLDAPVAELREAEDCRKIKYAVVVRPDGSTLKIGAEYFVLAAGGIETPRILLSSNYMRSGGIGNDFDVVGRYFSTHPKADLASLALTRPVKLDHPLFTDRKFGELSVRAGLGFNALTQKERALLNHYIQLSPLFEYRAARLFEKIKGSAAVNSPLVDRNALLRGVLPRLGLVAFETVSRLSGLQPRAATFVLRGFLDQYPNPNNRVTLSKVRDSRGISKADISWRFTEDDRSSVLQFLKALDVVARRHNIGWVSYRNLASTNEWPITGIHSHFMGTTRMGSGPKHSVVDANCRVHGSDNLFIAGPSVFTTYGYANPVLTIVALSLRLAEHLRSKL
ncbi:MAG: GMC family oxidoreductase [Hyphomicrobiales bacterium]|nr:GMC family oxidoreductase [Hyphomicrobiales bacterium]